MDISQEPFFHKSHFVFKFTGKMPYAKPATRFVRACAVEMHMGISQEPFCAEIYRENAGRLSRGQRFA